MKDSKKQAVTLAKQSVAEYLVRMRAATEAVEDIKAQAKADLEAKLAGLSAELGTIEAEMSPAVEALVKTARTPGAVFNFGNLGRYSFRKHPESKGGGYYGLPVTEAKEL